MLPVGRLVYDREGLRVFDMGWCYEVRLARPTRLSREEAAELARALGDRRDRRVGPTEVKET